MTYQYQGLIGVSTTVKEQDGRIFIGYAQDCTAIAEYAKRLHNAGEFGSDDLKYAAKLPNFVIEQYMNETGVSFEEIMGTEVHIKRMVQDPKNDAFRIWKGAL